MKDHINNIVSKNIKSIEIAIIDENGASSITNNNSMIKKINQYFNSIP